MSIPRVSCTMVTRTSRLGLAREAIGDFSAQTYPARDLVVLVEDDAPHAGGRTATERLLELADQAGCRGLVRAVIHVEPGLPLGDLRNRTLRHSGEFFAQWDDDDRYHPERLEAQVASLPAGGRASVLFAQVYQVLPGNACWVVDWRLSPTSGTGRMIPGTLLARNNPDTQYPAHLRLGEDTGYLRQLIQAGAGIGCVDRPGLYVRRWHGIANATSRERFTSNIRDRGWDRFRLAARFDELRRDLAAYRWAEQPGPLCAADGVFRIELGP